MNLIIEFKNIFKDQNEFSQQKNIIKRFLNFVIFFQISSLIFLLVGLIIALSPSISSLSSIYVMLFSFFVIFLLISLNLLWYCHIMIKKLKRFNDLKKNKLNILINALNFSYIGYIILPIVCYFLIDKITSNEKK